MALAVERGKPPFSAAIGVNQGERAVGRFGPGDNLLALWRTTDCLRFTKPHSAVGRPAALPPPAGVSCRLPPRRTYALIMWRFLVRQVVPLRVLGESLHRSHIVGQLATQPLQLSRLPQHDVIQLIDQMLLIGEPFLQIGEPTGIERRFRGSHLQARPVPSSRKCRVTGTVYGLSDEIATTAKDWRKRRDQR